MKFWPRVSPLRITVQEPGNHHIPKARNILDEFGQKEIYAGYVIGELHCEDLDDDSEEEADEK